MTSVPRVRLADCPSLILDEDSCSDRTWMRRASRRAFAPASSMARGLSIALGLGMLAGCAARPTLPVACSSDVATIDSPNRASPTVQASGCSSTPAAEQRSVRLAGIRETGSQTRTVGVPRGFLIVMIVLLVLLAA